MHTNTNPYYPRLSRTIRILTFLLSSHVITNAVYAQNWGSNTFSQTINEANDVEINAVNESYMAGYISGQTSFNSTTSVSSSFGNTDAVVVKYSTSGSPLWIKQFGGSLADKAIDLAIGPDQNPVIVGQFSGTVNFGSTSLTSTANSRDIFIVKLDPSGNVLWARKEGGNQTENAYKVTVDHQNNVILTGEYQGNSTIGPNTFTSSAGSFDIFIAKYNSGGTPLWSLSGYADYDDKGLAVAVDSQNNIFMTGQFSDTLNFASNNYNNNGFNTGFICKLDPAGQLQFLYLMKAGYTMPYDIQVNQNDEPVVTGDFLGNMNYYDQSGAHSIQNPYDKHLFVLKTSNSGQYQWSYTLGSDNELSAKAIAIDPTNNVFVTGYFKCDLSQIQDTTEQLLNAVGYRDAYLLKISNSGSRIYIKQFGGKLDDEGKSIAVNQSDRPYVCGSYTSDLNFNFGAGCIMGNDSYTFNQFTGPEPLHVFLTGDQSRNSFVTNHVNAQYNDYDYFKILTPADSVEGYISTYPAYKSVTLINDTIHFCTSADLFYEPLTYNHMGPDYTLTWYNGSHNPTTTITASGNYWVINERVDGCYTATDSIVAIKEQAPTLPLMTDDLGINVMQPGPNYNDYHFCYPQGTNITFSGLTSGDSLTITGDSASFSGVGPHYISQELNYYVRVENDYCSRTGSFTFDLDYALPHDSISLDIAMLTDFPSGDSIIICENQPVQFHGIDLIENPAGNFSPMVSQPIDSVIWIIDGTQYVNYDTVATIFGATTSGWHTVMLTVFVGYDNLCGVDTVRYTATKPFYIGVNPNPVWDSDVQGVNELCPGTSEYLVATNPNPNLSWSGSNILWDNAYDSIQVNAPGWYYYGGTISDSATGCSSSISTSVYVSVKVAPNISSSPGDAVICPFDSLLMNVPNTYSDYTWIGPNGDTLSTSNICYATEAGYYTCEVTDTGACHLVSPPFEVFQYATPSISASPSPVLCSFESVELEVIHSGSANIIWLNSGVTDDHLTVTTPGTYTVQVSQCGITVTDSVIIVDGSFNATLTASDTVLCFGDTATLSGSYTPAIYAWNTGDTTASSYDVTTTGNYYAVVTNTYGCMDTTNTIHIISDPGSIPPYIPNQVVCSGDDVTLSDSVNAMIRWYTVQDTSLLFTGTQVFLSNLSADTSFLISFTSVSNLCGVSYATVSIQVLDSNEFAILGNPDLCTNKDALFSVPSEYTVQWSLNGITLGNSNPLTIPWGNFNDTDILTASTSNICFATSDSIQLHITTPATLQLNEDTLNLCKFESGQLSVTNGTFNNLTWTGSFGSYTGSIFTANGNQSYGIITVFGEDLNGCSTDTTSAFIRTSNYTMSLDLSTPVFCPDEFFTLTAVTNADSIRWSTPNGISSTSNVLSYPLDYQHIGTYRITAWDELGCQYLDSIQVDYPAIPQSDFFPDTVFCANTLFTIPFPSDSNQYYWNNYGTNTTIPITGNDSLILNILTPAGCHFTDTIVLQVVNCDDPLPNIITPNGDGVNDYFIIDDAKSQLGNYIIIVNRWGNLVFEAGPYLNNFDGRNVSEGVYFYVYYPFGKDNPKMVKHGFIHVFY